MPKRDTYGTESPQDGPLRRVGPFRSTEEIEAELGEQLRRVRVDLGIPQDELARRANVSLTVVRNVERGRGAHLSSVVKLAAALGVVDTWLLSLAPELKISPIEAMRARGLLAERRRAPRRDPLPGSEEP